MYREYIEFGWGVRGIGLYILGIYGELRGLNGELGRYCSAYVGEIGRGSTVQYRKYSSLY
jgi:hypothetical protein